tara:strand:- start:2921 stop:3301 length:381 start_codon:yes stop_codon:yes gene_type:complete
MTKNTKSFLRFHRENPHVYDKFCHVTLRAIRRGYSNFGASAVFEIMRWETGVVHTTTTKHLSNVHRAYYARWFEMHHPEHEGFFRKRPSSADELKFLSEASVKQYNRIHKLNTNHDVKEEQTAGVN